MKSILSDVKRCYVCGSYPVHRHHIFYGTANRKKSEQYGCWIYLCPRHHNMSNEGVHFNKNLDLAIKRQCEKRFKEVYPKLDFIKIFGKSYL